MNRAFVLALTVLLAGCGSRSGPAEPDNKAEATGQSSNLPRPGLYEATMIPEVIGNAPPVTIPQETKRACFTASAMTQPDIFFLADTFSCNRDEVRIADGEVTARLRCNAPDWEVQDVPFELHGTYNRDGAELTGDLSFPDGTLRTTRILKRIGDC